MVKLIIRFLQHPITRSRRWRKEAKEVLLFFAVLTSASLTQSQEITADINVQLQPIVEHIDVVTDINVVGKSMFICTQPGQLYRKDLSGNSAAELFLDLRSEVGQLGSHIPGLPSLGYPDPETYDERGLLGFVADPDFENNGRFWVWYSNINERSPSPAGFSVDGFHLTAMGYVSVRSCRSPR